MLRLVMIDLSGTLHIGNKVIPGAVESLNKLRRSNVAIKFVTNTTKESKNKIYNRLINLGFTLSKDEIHSSLSAARAKIDAEKLKPMLLIAPEALEDFAEVPSEEVLDAVVVGLAPTEFHYDRLNDAFRCLRNGAKLIAVHAGKYYETETGLSLGPGAFVKALEYSANCKAEVVGKPNLEFFKSALGNVSPDEAVMIGDDVNDDIDGAQKAGISAFLVRTGKYRRDDEKKISPAPKYVVEDFSEAVERIFEKYGLDG